MSGKSALSVRAVKDALKKPTVVSGVGVNPLAAKPAVVEKPKETVFVAPPLPEPVKETKKRGKKAEEELHEEAAAVAHEEELHADDEAAPEKKIKVKQQFVLVTDSVSHLRERGLVPKKALSPGQYNSASPADAARKAGRSLASLFFNNSECSFDFSILNTGTGKKYDYTFSRSPLDGDSKEVIRKGIDKATGEAKEVKYVVKFKNTVTSRNPRGRKKASDAAI